MQRLLILPVGVLLLSLCCFPFAPVADYLVTEEPKMEDITGTYKYALQNILDEEVINISASSIELFADGSCRLIDFPIIAEETLFTYRFIELRSVNCTWKKTTYGRVSQWGNSLPVWAICFNAADFIAAVKCASLTDDGEPYNLVFVFGDPDSNEIMVYKKAVSK